MAYQVTARKWRPQKFEDVVGQEHITATLKKKIKSNQLKLLALHNPHNNTNYISTRV